MNRSNVALYSVQQSNSVGLIERQYCQYPLYKYTDISDETPIWTVVALPSLKYSILIQMALLNVNIVNILCQYPLFLYPNISVEIRIWTAVAWPSKQYSILIQWAFLNVNIVNIHCISTLTFVLKLQFEP
jgi:hypothetical protein